MPLVIENVEGLRALVGREAGAGEWLAVTQERIDAFAAATGDQQWIHVDPARAARESPYGGTIAHGFLTLSLLSRSFFTAMEVRGVRFAVNYGLNRVRFPSAVPAGSRVRARFTLASLENIEGGVQATWSATVEREGGGKPCCVAEWITRYYVEP